METALTLVHKGAMEIATFSIYSFARNFGGTHRLQIHSDGSLDGWDLELLMKAAIGLEAEIILPKDREPVVSSRLERFPETAALVKRRGYFTKLELPIFQDGPFFYFDSDVILLSPISNLIPPSGGSAFSTEAWSWYFGICHDSMWIREKTPRRVNSGFYHVSVPFPFERMEALLERKMFDPNIPGNSDQEIMAYLYPDMLIYHPDDVKRSRVGKLYDLANLDAAALHFPGRMWKGHLDQIERLGAFPPRASRTLRFIDSESLTHLELIRMRTYMSLANSAAARAPIRMLRRLRGCFGAA
jgi:hypothetical protein